MCAEHSVASNIIPTLVHQKVRLAAVTVGFEPGPALAACARAGALRMEPGRPESTHAPMSEASVSQVGPGGVTAGGRQSVFCLCAFTFSLVPGGVALVACPCPSPGPCCPSSVPWIHWPPFGPWNGPDAPSPLVLVAFAPGSSSLSAAQLSEALPGHPTQASPPSLHPVTSFIPSKR